MTNLSKKSLVSSTTSKVMRANRGRDTSPEKKLRHSIHRQGLRYAIDVRPETDLNRRADIVFRSARVAVFVNGCFWHGCVRHFCEPKKNRAYWSSKIKKNRERDRQTYRLLTRRGWKLFVIWEHQDLEMSAKKIAIEVRSRRA
jgi:DNA mismatch endonuclease (patch repair protein)